METPKVSDNGDFPNDDDVTVAESILEALEDLMLEEEGEEEDKKDK